MQVSNSNLPYIQKGREKNRRHGFGRVLVKFRLSIHPNPADQKNHRNNKVRSFYSKIWSLYLMQNRHTLTNSLHCDFTKLTQSGVTKGIINLHNDFTSTSRYVTLRVTNSQYDITMMLLLYHNSILTV